MPRNGGASRNGPSRSAFRLALTYAFLGAAFVAAANIVLDLVVAGSRRHEFYEFVVDALVVVPTALVIYLLLSRELYAREQALAAERAGEERWSNLLKTAAEAIIGVDQDARIFLFNQSAERIFGYEAAEVRGQSVDVLIPEYLRERHHLHFQQAASAAELSGPMGRDRLIEGRRKDGTNFPAEAGLSKMRQDGRDLYTVILHDVSRRKKAEDALRKSHEELEERVRERTEDLNREREKLTRILDGMPDGIFIVDEDYRIGYTNPALVRDFGPAGGRSCYEYVYDNHEPCEDCTRCKGAPGTVVRFEWASPRTGKTYEVVSTMIAGVDGKASNLQVLRNVTERIAASKERERLLNEVDSQRQLFQTVVQNATVGIAVVDGADLRLKWANPQYGQFLEEPWRRTDVAGHPLEEVLPRARESGLLEIFRQVAHTGRMHIDPEYQYIGFERGITFWQWSALPLPGDGLKEAADVMILANDITDQVLARKRMEQLSAEAEYRADELRRAYGELQLRTHELAALLEVSRQLASTLELQPLLGLILERLKTVINYTSAAVLTANGAGVSIAAYRGPLPQEQIVGYRAPFEEVPDFSRLLQHREPLTIDDLQDDSPLVQEFTSKTSQRLLQSLGAARSLLSVPLLIKGEMIGMLRFDHLIPGYFTFRHAQLALMIANQAATALENARLYREAKKVAALQERQRLARELHDSVSQTLYGISLSTHAAREMLRRNPLRAGSTLDNVLALTQTALSEMRSLIFELHPDSLKQEGLAVAFAKLADAARARYNLQVHSDLCPEPDLGVEVKEALYRICQESLRNAAKHARASNITIRLLQSPNATVLEVTDDGLGFDPGGSFPGHFGLRSMHERAAALGGTLSIESSSGGTCVRAVIPAPLENHAPPPSAGSMHE